MFRSDWEKTEVIDMEHSKNWARPYYYRRCKELGIEDMYNSYRRRMFVCYLPLFITVHAVTSFVHAMLLLSAAHRHLVYLDMSLYLLSPFLVSAVLWPNFSEERVKRHRWIPYLTSYAVVLIIMLIDISLNLYHFLKQDTPQESFYDTYLLFVIYFYMPIPHILPPFILGIIPTIIYNVYFIGLTQAKANNINSYLAYSIQLIGINLIGAFFRYMRDIIIRSSFLDRYLYIEEDILLRDAKGHQQTLLHSILPPRIAQRLQMDIENRIQYKLMRKKMKNAYNEKLSKTVVFEPHTDVSILYADVVNYTSLTTMLDVQTLVELLHDLYYRFDEASQQYNVQRIKFLGDCYYCVAGLSEPNEDHAKCCVDLGLRMIEEIREVRVAHTLNIDMRIGIHSGDLVAGVIGSAKFQYDVWSNDVDIANHLESTGLPGRVHISKQTLNLLDDEYEYEEGTEAARGDVMLKLWNIKTFLIKSIFPEAEETHFWLVKSELLNSESHFDEILEKRHSNLQAEIQIEMAEEMENMPVGKIGISKLFTTVKNRRKSDEEAQSLEQEISPFWMFFRERKFEHQYYKLPDPMLRYSIALALLVCLMLVYLSLLSQSKLDCYWLIDGFVTTAQVLFLVLAWYKKIWIVFIAKHGYALPRRKCSQFMYRASDTLKNNIYIRTAIYLFVLIGYCAILAMELWKCNREEFEIVMIESKLFNYDYPDLCFNPWLFSTSVSVILVIAFLFTRIPFIVKSVVGVILLIIYIVFAAFEYDYVFEDSNSTNIYLDPLSTHLLYVITTFICFYFMERQTEFNTKISFCWKRDLVRKRNSAALTNETINVLLNNILPSHIVNVYLNARRENELYYEEYENVAVMFASIKNFDVSNSGLRVLNEIICEFDEVLGYYTTDYKVEKIKVVGWTYMAACGLDIKRVERTSTIYGGVNSKYHSFGQFGTKGELTDEELAEMEEVGGEVEHELEVEDESQTKEKNEHSSQHNFNVNRLPAYSWKRHDSDIVVPVLAQFALDLMRILYTFNNASTTLGYGHTSEFGEMRIGLSYGRIMAGIVGLTTPHYDIWGNPVNMASRMDSTGFVGRMQVTEETAQILEKYNILCSYRGMTFVKGCGNIPTYFVSIDDDLDFVLKHKPHKNRSDDRVRGSVYFKMDRKESK